MAQMESSRHNECSCTHTFVINNFSKYDSVGQSITSLYFGIQRNEQDFWYLLCYPCGKKPDSDDDLSLYLHCHNPASKFIEPQLKYKLSIITADFKSKNEREDNHPGFLNDADAGLGYQCFIKRSELLAKGNAYLPNDRLTIACKLTWIPENIAKQKSTIINIPEDNRHNILKLLIQDKNVGEIVTLQVHDSEIKVYKGILASQSRVFAAMFGNEEKKYKQNVIVINGMAARVCYKMANFLQSKDDDLHDCNDYLDELLEAADKYGLDRLKALCEEALYENLNIENSANMLVTADSCNACQLKIAVLNFMKKNISDVLESDGYESLTREHPKLGCEILRFIYKKQKLTT